MSYYYDWSYELDKEAKSSRYDDSALDSTAKYNSVSWGSASVRTSSMSAIMDAYNEYRTNYDY